MTLKKALAAAVLYAATAIIANPVLAEPANLDQLREIRAGDMKKLLVHKTPQPAAALDIVTIDDLPLPSDHFKGKVLLVNFWATWCAPCRHEMPALDALQARFGGDTFQVVTIATGHNPIPAINRFFEKAEIKNLTVYRDPKQTQARKMSVFGLPTTMILNPEGQEIARLRGDADWAGADAVAIVKALLESPDDN